MLSASLSIFIVLRTRIIFIQSSWLNLLVAFIILCKLSFFIQLSVLVVSIFYADVRVESGAISHCKRKTLDEVAHNSNCMRR